MAFSDPQKILALFPLAEGGSVADFGAGSGHYTLSVARRVGEGGVVCAVDIQKELLSRIEQDAQGENLSNVSVIWGDINEAGGSRLADDSMNAVLLVNVLFQADRRGDVLKEAWRILKKGGAVLLVDWEASFEGLGPREEDVVEKDRACELFEKNGFVRERDISDHAGDYHYGFVFTKI